MKLAGDADMDHVHCKDADVVVYNASVSRRSKVAGGVPRDRRPEVTTDASREECPLHYWVILGRPHELELCSACKMKGCIPDFLIFRHTMELEEELHHGDLW